MTILGKPLRRQLETAVKQAREIAEAAVIEAIERIGVAPAKPPPHLSENNKALRRRLRAHGRSLGDKLADDEVMTTSRLQDAAAYEIWHRMLFGRFLVERGLLIHPDLGAAINVGELRELAQEEGAADEWALAEKYAAPSLPGVFKPDDPVLALQVAPEFSKRLRAILSSLPKDIFEADDSLGWTYQFWRASEKDAVNQAGGKIGAVELPAVTQLFTESYMVKFLLHNTLGAWWAGKVLTLDRALACEAANEEVLRKACSISGQVWEFLRFVRDENGKGPWRPAAGSFPGWPIRAAEITYCDPCCGSGHFLVEAFNILAALRRHEEGLSGPEAAVAVLRDNLHGLELDGRCVQIAAFNVALAAWKIAREPIPLPPPHIAWVGAPSPMTRTEMAMLGNGDASLRGAMETLYDLFVQAPELGSLLQVRGTGLLDADLRKRGSAALVQLRGTEPEREEGAVAARGLLDATILLLQHFVLLATNVPYLGRGKQAPRLAFHIAEYHEVAKSDLATAMLDRMFEMAVAGGTVACVTPQNWLYLNGYIELRKKVLRQTQINAIVTLGEEAWEEFGKRGPKATLTINTCSPPSSRTQHSALDTTDIPDRDQKIAACREHPLTIIRQESQYENPDSIISLKAQVVGQLLRLFAEVRQGVGTADISRFVQSFWEQSKCSGDWNLYQLAPSDNPRDLGKSGLLRWERGCGTLSASPQARVCGQPAWGRTGVTAAVTRSLARADYSGEKFDCTTAVIVPRDTKHLLAIYACVMDKGFPDLVRGLDVSLSVTESAFGKIPFNLAYWQDVAAERYPNGLEDPYCDDPTQWLFHGHPAFSSEGTELHVALARLAGYRWPAETDPTIRLAEPARKQVSLAKALPDFYSDGLLPLRGNSVDLSLADRMRAMLAAAYGAPLPPAREQALIHAADTRLDKKEARDATLEGWLADRAFRQHSALFRQRPFLWQIWDGFKNGFSAFLQYHRLDRAALERLTYTLLGDWIRAAKAEENTARIEHAERLQQSLANIIKGEKPFDIFIRWKSLSDQPLGWEPDLDDGVRLNIRPFVTAGVLREQPSGISWNKDRGTDLPTAPWSHLGPSYGGKNGDRINDHHTTLAEKRAAHPLAAE